MKKLLIIGGSPRPNGVSEELIRQVKPYFIDCKIVEYNTYKLAPAPVPTAAFASSMRAAPTKIWIFFLRTLKTRTILRSSLRCIITFFRLR